MQPAAEFSPQEIREASRSFDASTAGAPADLHVRHYALLPDAALCTLGLLLGLFEAIGELPPQIQFLVVALIPKQPSGLRPIGLFPGVYRLGGKLTAPPPQVSHWEAANHRAWLAVFAGRHPVGRS